ncbi:MAG: hypothetical protein ACJ8HQ_02580 [Chthoniobacterales bacterium]
MTWQKLSVLGVAIVALGLSAAPRAKAGEEMIEQESTPAPRYNYTQPQERVYYAAPAVTVGVYPLFGFGWPYGYYGYGYHRYYGGHHRYYGHGRYYGGRGYAGVHYRR